MKNTYLLGMMAVLLGPLAARAQSGGVGIGTTAPDASAVLELTAAGKGLLIPRLDSAARVAIAAPATGLLVFQTAPRAGFYYYGGAAAGWLFLADKARGGDNLGSHTATQSLNLRANALTGTGAELPAGVVGVGVRADGGLNIGQNTLRSVYLGYGAGALNTGFPNQFIGYNAGANNSSGARNHFVGYRAGLNNTTGSGNHFNGLQAGINNVTGDKNHFDGYFAGYVNSIGSNNHFSGYESGYFNSQGSYNTFSGYHSGYQNESGNYNTALGYEAGPTSDALTNATAIGARAQVSQSNSLVLGGTGANAVRVGIGTTAPQAPLEVQAGSPIGPTATGTETELRLTRPGTSGGKWNASAELALGTYAPGTNSQSQLDFRLGNGSNALADQTVLSLRGDGRVQVGQKVTTPATGAANMLAAGYGNVFGEGTLANASANVTVAARTAGSGEYVLTFTGALATADFGSTAVALTLFNGPGFASYVNAGRGKLLVRTYSPSGTLTDRGFSFVIFQP